MPREFVSRRPLVESLEKRALLASLSPFYPPMGQSASVGLTASAATGPVITLGVFSPDSNAARSTVATVLPMRTARTTPTTGSASSTSPDPAPAVLSGNSRTIRINFQPKSAATPSGYTADTGAKFGSKNGLTYGWNNDNTTDIYDRNSSKSPDQLSDTTARMGSSDKWSIALPKGWYDVSIHVGDTKNSSYRYSVNANGKLAVFVKDHAGVPFGEGLINVYVSDRLTLSNGVGASRNALTHVEITPTAAPKKYPQVNDLSWSKSGSIISPIGRVEPGVVRVGDKIYIMGGYSSPDYVKVTKRVDILDLKTNKWSSGASLPGPTTHFGATTDGRYIYTVGGQYGGLFSRHGTDEAYRYDTIRNRWTTLPKLPVVRFGGALAYIKGGLFYVGGDGPDRIHATTDSFAMDLSSAKPAWKRIASLPLAGDHLGHAVMNNVFYVIGGETDHGVSYLQHRYLFAYDPSRNVWARKADMPTGSSHFEGNIVEVNRKLWVFGGQIDAQQLSNEVRSYDPRTDSWTLHNSMPERRKGGASWYYNNKFYYLVGDSLGKGQPKAALVASFK